MYLKKAAVIDTQLISLVKEDPPEPFKSLLKLQTKDGTWRNLKAVRRCLNISEYAPAIAEKVSSYSFCSKYLILLSYR